MIPSSTFGLRRPGARCNLLMFERGVWKRQTKNKIALGFRAGRPFRTHTCPGNSLESPRGTTGFPGGTFSRTPAREPASWGDPLTHRGELQHWVLSWGLVSVEIWPFAHLFLCDLVPFPWTVWMLIAITTGSGAFACRRALCTRCTLPPGMLCYCPSQEVWNISPLQ